MSDQKARMAPLSSAPPGLEQDERGNPIPFEERTLDDQEKARATAPHAKVAETSRMEREQGGQPNASASGDTNANAAGPHDKPELTTDATKGTGMLPTPGEASDNDMAPGG